MHKTLILKVLFYSGPEETQRDSVWKAKSHPSVSTRLCVIRHLLLLHSCEVYTQFFWDMYVSLISCLCCYCCTTNGPSGIIKITFSLQVPLSEQSFSLLLYVWKCESKTADTWSLTWVLLFFVRNGIQWNQAAFSHSCYTEESSCGPPEWGELWLLEWFSHKQWKSMCTSGRLQLWASGWGEVYLDSSSRQLRTQEESEELIQETWSVSAADPGHQGGRELLFGQPGLETEADQKLRSWAEAGERPLWAVEGRSLG